MAEILLTSEKFVKDVSNISDNVAGKYLLPSMREAQEIGLRAIIGEALLTRLKEMVADGSISAPENDAYKDLLDRAQYFLAYQTIVEVCGKVSYKIGNFGVAKSNDENLQVATADEIARTEYYYQSKADFHMADLQRWILRNRAAFPELSECCCNMMRAHLRTMNASGVFLGGARGKVLGNGNKCCGR